MERTENIFKPQREQKWYNPLSWSSRRWAAVTIGSLALVIAAG